MNRNNKKITTSFIILSLFLIGLVYAILQANLQINGTAKIQANTWDIHFDNIQVNSNSVAIGAGDSAATIDPENNCKVDFEVTLSIPGDFYEFTVDVVNAGTIDGMIGELDKTLKVNNEVVQETPDYLDYSVTYADGDEIIKNHKLDAGSTETYKVRLEFKTDIEELPQATTITTSLEPQYLQADSSSVYRADADFATSSWDEIVKTYKIGNLSKLDQAMRNGTSKIVLLDKDLDGTYETTVHVRIANLSKPADCSTSSFSQTACGFVIQFIDGVKNNTGMNTSYTSTGGWQDCNMRAYLNNGKYREGQSNEIDYANTGFLSIIPSDLYNVIIDTFVVSGHGLYDNTNFMTTDKMFLFSTKEIWGKAGTDRIIENDTAELETRQLDFYDIKEVTTYDNISSAIINCSLCWLRSACSDSSSAFYLLTRTGGWSRYNATDGLNIAPAFRIAE